MTSPRVLSHAEARRVYDRIGRWQDTQAFYEDVAVNELVAQSGLEAARSVAELGCGTGRHAARLISECLPSDARYRAFDQSDTMVSLARERLAGFGDRVTVQLTRGAPLMPLGDATVDRVLSTYVLDLLSHEDIRSFVDDAYRVLVSDGRLCLVSLTSPRTTHERVVARLVGAIHRVSPALVGGCRPVELRPFLDDAHWDVLHHRIISMLGVPSEILVAAPRGK